MQETVQLGWLLRSLASRASLPPVAAGSSFALDRPVVLALAAYEQADLDPEPGTPALWTGVELRGPRRMFLLALRADEDLFSLPDRHGPWGRAFHRIRLNPSTPITRHEPILMDLDHL